MLPNTISLFECFNCGYQWAPAYSTGEYRSLLHALGEICPQCNTQNIIGDNE